MKPVLLLNIGTPFSATSPLHYTLGWDNKYAHTGHQKEHHYLYVLESDKQLVNDGQVNNSHTLDQLKDRLSTINERRNPNKPKILSKDSEYVKFDGKDFYSKEISIQKYINYYLTHYNHIKEDYKAVADFSNANACLSEEFMLSIKDELLKHFDVKVTVVFRDPVRRLWSISNKFNNRSTFSSLEINPNPHDWIKMCVGGKLEPNCYYHDIIRRHRNVWGDDRVHPIIMEEFWAGDTQPLSDFLDFPITKLHENVYYPDMGANPPHYEYLKDQWSSDKVDLDDQTRDYCLDRLSYLYKLFEDEYGRIPEAWMK